MILSPAQRLFLIRDQIIGAAVFNLGLNAGLGWLVFRETPSVPLWSNPGMAADLAGMFFFLPLLTGLCVAPIVMFLVRFGKLEPLVEGVDSHPLIKRLPEAFWARALVAAVVSLCLFAPPLIGLLALLGITSLPLMTFVATKGLLGAVLAAVVQPILALGTLARLPRPRA